MSLTAGSRLSFYEVLAPLGAGAMGEVWRAKDTRLEREVAIKVLPEHFADDEERLRRFEREAKTLASLNHPNVAQIFGVDQVGDTCFLVLELVPGESLEERLKRGPLSIDETLDVCTQIAAGLEAAHEAGVIHRDLKPANIRLTPEGKVKVLDFGLAKPLSEGGRGSSTDSVLSTESGRLLGTPTYMAPEQARGKAIDKRVDIWAFGCVLYECLTAKRAFAGDSLTDVLGAVLHTTPDFTALPKGVPPALRVLLERCLAKDRAQRLPDASVVRFLLAEPSLLAPSAQPAPPRRSIGVPLALAGIAAAVLVTLALTRLIAPNSATAPSARLTRATVVLPAGVEIVKTNLVPLALSPDGSVVVCVGQREGGPQLFVRDLVEHEARVLEGTEGASMPFFSPDGKWIAFFAQRDLKRIAVSGAGLQTVATDVPDPRGGSWGSDGTIIFAPTNASGLMKVPAAGGSASVWTTTDRSKGEISHRWPQILPDHDHVLFTIWTGPGFDEREIVVQSIATGERHSLVSGGDGPRYVDGHLVYARLDGLFAVPWQPAQTDVNGAAPVALPEHVRQENEGAAVCAVSDTGTLAFLQGGPERYKQRVLWVDRAGIPQPTPLPERNYESLALAPDGRRVVVQIMEGVAGLWLYDFSRDTLTPFATTNGSSQAAVWSPDGRRILYRGTRAGSRNVYWKSADGTGSEERLTSGEGMTQTPSCVSPDGEWLVYLQQGGRTQGGSDIFAVRLTGNAAEPIHARVPVALAQSGASEVQAQVSPDGRWLAYVSDVSAKREVYVQPFPGPGPVQQVSTDGGVEPLWSPDGRELFFAKGDKLMAVDVKPGAEFTADRPHPLFEGRFRPSPNANTPYSISADGQRFLRVQQGHREEALTRIELVLGWAAQLPMPAAR